MRIAGALRSRITGGRTGTRALGQLARARPRRAPGCSRRRRAEGGDQRYALFRDLETDLWALLLTQQYHAFPNFRAPLPDVPDPAPAGAMERHERRRARGSERRFLQAPSRALRRAHRPRPDGSARARLRLRLGATDALPGPATSPPGRLDGCDPAQQILDACAQDRVPAILARSEFVPQHVPSASTSIWPSRTRSSPISPSGRTRPACGRCMRPGWPGAILVVHPSLAGYTRDGRRSCAVSVPRASRSTCSCPMPPQESHPQYEGGEITYGEAIITLPYIARALESAVRAPRG